jgi:Acetyltransferase (GNAT) domain
MIEIVKYKSSYKSRWDDFVSKSKNGSLLFYRDYMEYHSDRFVDSSLLFFGEGDLVAIMPANIADDVFYSHAGLTFGGVVSNRKMRIETMLELFDALIAYLSQHRIKTAIYKAIPHIYHIVPAEEDLYALFRHNAKVVHRDASSAIFFDQQIPFNRQKRRYIKLGMRNELVVKRVDDFRAYMSIVAEVTARKFSVAPTHTAKEMELLSKRFPENIKLFAAYKDETMLAGVIMFEHKSIAHAQYSASSDEGEKLGAGDLVWDYLINDYYSGSSKRYFDFGRSTEKGGRYLNAGLNAHKEALGARATMYDTYKVDVANNKSL